MPPLTQLFILSHQQGIGNGVSGMGHGAWGMGYRAWGIGYGAWGMGHGVSGISTPSPEQLNYNLDNLHFNISTMPQTFYVNPVTGNDAAAGTQAAPFKTLTKALNQAQADTTIQLAAGTYNSANGEVFPLNVPPGMKVIGNEGNKGSGILIIGSGEYVSPTIARQSITILLANNAELRGVTVTNQARRGTGVWLESTAGTVANCTFTKCDRDGVLATGNAKPLLLNNLFTDNGGNGVSLTRNAQGEVRGNSFTKAGYGISIDGTATPRIIDNTITENRFGVGVSMDAKPVLRNNRIENNQDYGIATTGNGEPDLGKTQQDRGNNIIRNNGKLDILNSTKLTLISFGNTLNPTKVSGTINIDGLISSGGGSNTGGDGTVGSGGGSNPGDGNTGGNTQEKPRTFPDIQNHWAKLFIEGLLAKDLISGFSDGTFKPDQQMTRAQYAALLVKAFNPPAKRNPEVFTDVDNNFWAKDVIQQAYRSEFMSGFPNKTFKPNDQVQRVQVIVSLVNGLGLSATDGNALNVYQDRLSIPDYAKDEVTTATRKQMVVNYPDLKLLNPTQAATRGEVAALVYQALVNNNQVSAVNSPYIVVAGDSGAETPPIAFADIQNHWAKPFIEGLAAQGLVGGFSDGTFKPDERINRAQLAAFIVKAFNPAMKREAKRFSDVSDSFWAQDVIQWAYRAGFVSGYPDNTFRPNDPVQKVQLIVSLVSGLGLLVTDGNALNVYQDRNLIPDYAKNAVTTATKKRLVVNYPDIKLLNPSQVVTRGEVAAMIYQALVDANVVSAVGSSYVVSV